MSGLKSLTSAQISAIASALAGTTPTPTPTPTPGPTPTPTPTPPPATSGATLYATYCAGCHGTLSQSSVGGASSSEIQSAIHGGVSQMSSLSSLTSTQISAIAAALAGVRSSDSILGQAAPSSGGLQPLLFARMDMNALPSKVARSFMS